MNKFEILKLFLNWKLSSTLREEPSGSDSNEKIEIWLEIDSSSVILSEAERRSRRIWTLFRNLERSDSYANNKPITEKRPQEQRKAFQDDCFEDDF